MPKFIYIFILFFISFFSYSQTNEEIILKDSEFKILAQKATAFYTSEAYINFEKISEEFSDKVGKSFYQDGSLKPEKYKSWIEKNLDKTNFTSLNETVAIYEKYYNTFLYAPDDKEILDLLFKLDDKYGSENFTPLFAKHVLHAIFKVWEGHNINQPSENAKSFLNG